MTYEDDRVQRLARLHERWADDIDTAHYRFRTGNKVAAKRLLNSADNWAIWFWQTVRNTYEIL